jgi:hypothetical protein
MRVISRVRGKLCVVRCPGPSASSRSKLSGDEWGGVSPRTHSRVRRSVRQHVCIGKQQTLVAEAASHGLAWSEVSACRGSQPPPSGQALLSSHFRVKATASSLPWGRVSHPPISGGEHLSTPAFCGGSVGAGSLRQPVPSVASRSSVAVNSKAWSPICPRRLVGRNRLLHL